MKDRNAKYLLERYPQFFQSFLQRGEHAHHQIGVGDGWYPIIHDVCSQLWDLQKKAAKKRVAIVIDFVQIKEKLGGLRLYKVIIVHGNSSPSNIFGKFDNWLRTLMCSQGFYKAYWATYRFRRKYLWQSWYEKAGEIISNGEQKSYVTCEVCGGEGKRCSPNGWILTLCEKHENESKKETD